MSPLVTYVCCMDFADCLGLLTRIDFCSANLAAAALVGATNNLEEM